MSPLARHRHLRGGSWNMRRDRDRGMAATGALQAMVDHDLDFLLLQETRQYLGKLAALPDTRLVAWDERGRANTAVLVRDGVDVSSYWCPRMTTEGWFVAGTDHETTDKHMVTALLDDWLRVGSLHYPPSVRFGDGWLPRGPVRRVAAFAQHARREVRFVRRRPPQRALLLGGDRNATPGARGRYSPRWVADKTGLEVFAPDGPTHGGTHGRTIDFALGRGVDVRCKTGDRYGSDHRLVVMSILEAP